MGELIVRFTAGITAEAAEQTVADLGGSVRRRMRTDGPDQVQLLVKVPQADLDARTKQFEARPEVDWVEVNSDGYRPLD